MQWFEVDREGLRNLLGRKGKSFVVTELIQNGLDQEGTKNLEVRLEKTSRGRVLLEVTDDDPEGFADLSHAFTLFADTAKRGNPTQRGRFNVGEKLVLAVCDDASIASTTGTIIFDEDGRKKRRIKTTSGSKFIGHMSMNNNDIAKTRIVVRMILPPKHVRLTFNDEEIPYRAPITTITTTLPTEIAEPGRPLRKTSRKTVVEIHEVGEDEPAMIYEMGIPVVATGDKFHVNVMQKVPLNIDRDNVSPAYLQTIRSLVLNATFDRIKGDEVNADWVRAATSDKRCSDDAITKALDLRFGKKRVAYDPSDPEANLKAASRGFTVIKGRQLSGTEWNNAKRANTVPPAGKVTPAKPNFTHTAPDVPDDQVTDKMRAVKAYAQLLAKELMDVTLVVRFLDGRGFSATYDRRSDKSATLVFYVPVLGKRWFDLKNNIVDIDRLLIHEFGHQFTGNHLTKTYHESLCLLGAKLKQVSLKLARRQGQTAAH